MTRTLKGLLCCLRARFSSTWAHSWKMEKRRKPLRHMPRGFENSDCPLSCLDAIWLRLLCSSLNAKSNDGEFGLTRFPQSSHLTTRWMYHNDRTTIQSTNNGDCWCCWSRRLFQTSFCLLCAIQEEWFWCYCWCWGKELFQRLQFVGRTLKMGI